jgi:hypothetical protein
MAECTISAEIGNDNKRSNRTKSIPDVIICLLCPACCATMLLCRAWEDEFRAIGLTWGGVCAGYATVDGNLMMPLF